MPKSEIIHGVENVISALREAKTIRQVLSAPMPAPVYRMENAQEFAQKFKELDETQKGLIRQQSSAIVGDDGAICYREQNIPEMFKELENAVIDAERLASPDGTLKPGLEFYFKAGVNRREITHMHSDYPASPDSRMYLFRTDAPTKCLSGEDQLDLIEKHHPQAGQILDQSFDDLSKLEFTEKITNLFNVNNRQVKFTPYGRALASEAPKRLAPLGEGTLEVMPAVTLHQKQPFISEGPVFHAVVFDPAP